MKAVTRHVCGVTAHGICWHDVGKTCRQGALPGADDKGVGKGKQAKVADFD